MNPKITTMLITKAVSHILEVVSRSVDLSWNDLDSPCWFKYFSVSVNLFSISLLNFVSSASSSDSFVWNLLILFCQLFWSAKNWFEDFSISNNWRYAPQCGEYPRLWLFYIYVALYGVGVTVKGYFYLI